jgi:hypothetical protein
MKAAAVPETVTPVAETKAAVSIPEINTSADAATSNPEPPKPARKESNSAVQTAANDSRTSPAVETRQRVKPKKRKYYRQDWGFNSFGYGGYPRVRSYY